MHQFLNKQVRIVMSDDQRSLIQGRLIGYDEHHLYVHDVDGDTIAVNRRFAPLMMLEPAEQ